MRLRIMHDDTTLAQFIEDYKVNRPGQEPASEPLSEHEVAEVWRLYNEHLEKLVPRLIPGAVEDARSPSRAQQRAAMQMCAAAAVSHRRHRALQLFVDLTEIVKELVRRFRIRLKETEPDHITFTHIARTALGARAIDTVQSIELLLRSGYTPGAWALWRTLHELAVVTKFITKQGEDVAKAYVEHGYAQSHRTLKAYGKHSSIKSDPHFQNLLAESGALIEALRSNGGYGTSFETNYGWAVCADIKKRCPDFSDVELSVGMSVARPEYQRASHVVHPGIRGLLDHQAADLDTGLRQPWDPTPELLDEPLALTAKTLTALAGGMIDLSSPMSDVVLIGAIGQLRDELLTELYPDSAHAESSTLQ